MSEGQHHELTLADSIDIAVKFGDAPPDAMNVEHWYENVNGVPTPFLTITRARGEEAETLMKTLDDLTSRSETLPPDE